MTCTTSQPTNGHTTPQNATATKLRALFLVGLVTGCLLALVASSLVAPAAAANTATPTATPNVSDKAPMYPNNSTAIANQSWMAGQQDPSIANVSQFVVRIPTFIVGTGVAQGGAGQAGVLIFGVAILGAIASLAVQPRVGVAGGSVLTVVGIYGGVAASVLPFWMWGLTLFGIGIVATSVVLLALR